MYVTGKGGGNCLKNASDGYLFVFDGGSPGWQEAGGQPTVETEILVSRDGASIIVCCLQWFTALIEESFQECGLNCPAAPAGLFCGLIELHIIRALEELQSV